MVLLNTMAEADLHKLNDGQDRYPEDQKIIKGKSENVKHEIIYYKYQDDLSGRRLGSITSLSHLIQAGDLLGRSDIRCLIPDQYSVGWAMDIANYTQWPMKEYFESHWSGLIKQGPLEIPPGERQVMIGHNTSGGAYGSFGSVSWVLGNKRVHVMWSLPFNHNHHSNTLAVGITNKDDVIPENQKTYEAMYYTDQDWFKRKTYTDSITETWFCKANELCITGSMGTGHHATINIKVFPVSCADLAMSLRGDASCQTCKYMSISAIHQ